jgi:hypothetical protein
VTFDDGDHSPRFDDTIMLARDTVMRDPRQKKTNLIFQSSVHLENFASAIIVRITQENDLRVLCKKI